MRWFPRFSLPRHYSSQAHSIRIPGIDASFSYRWLRDACQCPTCVHPSTKQKLHRTTDVAAHIPVPRSVDMASGAELRIEWGEGHKSVYPLSWLRRYVSRDTRAEFHGDVPRTEWNRAILEEESEKNLFVDYATIRKDNAALRATMIQLLKFGLVFVKNIPNEETSDDRCELRNLAGTLGRIRETFYGAVWDVRSVKDSKNIAYTSLDLGLHMDLLYMNHPPRYQILHCLRNRVRGGTSYFVDAIHAASLLHRTHPSAFTCLTQTPVPYHYINDNHHLHHAHPVIQLTPASRIEYINYSPPFQAPLHRSTPDEFYGALKEYTDLLARKDGEFRYTLNEGDAAVFDNRRVLHARTEFWDEGKEGETNRWLKGCYLEADDVLDRVRILGA